MLKAWRGEDSVPGQCSLMTSAKRGADLFRMHSLPTSDLDLFEGVNPFDETEGLGASW